jgi:UPF0716 family protein affecting phage T7 exclusion
LGAKEDGNVFYVLGWLGIIAGGGWAALAIQAAASTSSAISSPAASDSALAGVAGVLVAAPGIGLMFSGLLLLAIAGGLSRLDGILRHSRRTARIMQTMAERAAGE